MPASTLVAQPKNVYDRLELARRKMREDGRKAGPLIQLTLNPSANAHSQIAFVGSHHRANTLAMIRHAGADISEEREWALILEDAWRQGVADAIANETLHVVHIKALGTCRSINLPNALLVKEDPDPAPAIRHLEDTFLIFGEGEFPTAIALDPRGFSWENLTVVARKDFKGEALTLR